MKSTKVRITLPDGPREVTFERNHLEVVFQDPEHDEPVTLRFHELQPGVYRVTLGGRQEIVYVEPGTDQVVVQTRYRRYRIPVERAERRGAARVQAGEVTVQAPMSGLVVEILKEAGDTVKEGEALLILEAMKMRSEITAPITGILRAFHVEPGQSVSAGQNLVTLRAEESGV